MSETTTLELVDAALAEGRATATEPDDRELQLLALAVRDETTPEPDLSFVREMDEWAAAGFQRRPDQRPRRGPGGALLMVLDTLARGLRTPAGIAVGATAVAAIAIVAVLVADSSTTTTDTPISASAKSSSGGGAAATGTREAAPSASDSAGGAASAPSFQTAPSGPRDGAGAAPGQPQRIERQAELTLAAPEDEFQTVADRIVQVADRRGGFVLRSSVSSGDGGAGGDFQLRVPADQLQATLRDLSALADVKARSQSGQDVTAEYVSAHDSLQSMRAERRGLLRRLAAAGDDATANRLRDRLDKNAREIAALRSQLRQVLQRTNYATVSVALQKSGSKGHGGGVATGSTGAALDDSLGLLVGSFNWLLRALGVLIPTGIVVGGGWWAGRVIRRRRREAVLF